MHQVFVYGTLKRGFCRHNAISAQNFLGLAKTEPCYKLFDLGEYPGLVASESGTSIDGELYKVDDDCLANLDMIEGISEGYYCRERVQLLPPWHDQSAMTYLYQHSVDGHPEISSWAS